MPISRDEFFKLLKRGKIQGKSANELEYKIAKFLDQNNIKFKFKEKIRGSREWEVDFLILFPFLAIIECKYSKSNDANTKIQSGEAFMLLMDLKYNAKDERLKSARYIFIREFEPPGKELGEYVEPFRAFGIEVYEQGKDWKKALLKI